MSISHQQKVQHLYWRGGFGHTLKDMKANYHKPFDKVVDDFFKASEGYEPLVVNHKYSVSDYKGKKLSKEQIDEVMRISIELLKRLNLNWNMRLVSTDRQLVEKMTYFWHGHFAAVTGNYIHGEQYNNLLRENALGNFGTMLRAVSKSPAMLAYLNAQQNKKGNPNENFSRELLELFTLGVGNYTERDIKEAARSFTGWAFNNDAEFINYPSNHDTGVKNFLGRSGNFDGDDIIDIILAQKQTAIFITSKVYEFFVNEKPDQSRINSLANEFYDSGYDIKTLMGSIFRSDWFYSRDIVGSQIKSPIEFMIGFMRMFDITLQDPAPLLFFQKLLGQILLKPPNVAGWPGGRNWIDSSSLLARMNLAKHVIEGSEINMQAKEENFMEVGQTMNELENINLARYRKPKATLNVKAFFEEYTKCTKAELPGKLEEYIIQCEMSGAATEVMRQVTMSSKNMIRDYSLKLMGLPEYQMC